jgi:hypothetical protein
MSVDPFAFGSALALGGAAFALLVAGLYTIPRDLRTPRRTRRGLRWATGGLVALASSGSLAATAWKRRALELERIERRARPLVAAIAAHEREFGRLPATLPPATPWSDVESGFSYTVDDEGYAWLTLADETQRGAYFVYEPSPTVAGFAGGRWSRIED